jgi:hypothetical protein
VPVDKDHLFKSFAALYSPKDRLEQRSQGLGIDRVEDFAHAAIAGHLPDAVDLLQVTLFALIVKGQQGRRFQGEQSKGGHERVGQWNLGRAWAMIGDSAKAGSQPLQQRIRGQVFAHSGSPRRHHILRGQKGALESVLRRIMAWRFTKGQTTNRDGD